MKEKYNNFNEMNISLYIEENNFIKLCLLSGKKEIDCLEWQDRNDLSRAMLANLDKILKKNGASLDKISGYKIISEVPKKWTTCRIAEITLRSLMLARLAR